MHQLRVRAPHGRTLLAVVLVLGLSCGQAWSVDRSVPDWKSERATPGVVLRLVEEGSRKTGHCGAGPCTEVRYRVDFYPPLKWGAGYSFWMRTSLAEPTRMTGRLNVVRIGGLRPILSADLPTASGQPVIYGSFPRGVALRVAAIADDGSVQASDEVFPFPIESVDGPCRLWAELAGPQGDAFVARGRGFPPGAKMPGQLVTGGREIALELQADASGGLPAIVLSAPPRGAGQAASLMVRAATCSPQIQLEFGAAALVPAQ